MPGGLRWNPARFGSGYVKRKVSRQVNDFLEGLNKDGKGPERVTKMVSGNRRLDSLIPQEKLTEYLALARQYSWVTNMISDADLLQMMPAWVIQAVRAQGPDGFKWLRAQLDWLRHDVFSPS